MENLKFYVFLLIGIAAFVLHVRKREDLNDVLAYLFALSITFLMKEGLENSGQRDLLIYTLIGMISFGFLISRTKWAIENKWSWLLPLLIAIVPIWLGKKEFSYNNYQFSLDGPVFALVFLGTILELIAEYKSKFVVKFLGISDAHRMKGAMSLLLTGFAVFVGSFFASFFGVFMVGIGVLLSSFFTAKKDDNFAISLLLISLASYFLQLVGLDTIDLTLGKVLEGMFFGAFAVVVIKSTTEAKKYALLGLYLGLFFALACITVVLMLVTQKTDFGGVDSYVAALFGIAITSILLIEFKHIVLLASFALAIGFIFAPLTVNKEEQEMLKIEVPQIENDENEVAEVKSPFELKNISLDSIPGKYKINEKSVQLNFQLGPKGGVTKGVFKSFSGMITIPEDIEKSSFEIELPVDQLSTFNRMRDESLMEKEYFNVGLYPLMKFESKKLEVKDDVYILKGNFYMLGKVKPLDVQLKYIGKLESNGEKVTVLVGKSTIDRTQFGMTPDSKEGNSVDFEFKVELIKQ